MLSTGKWIDLQEGDWQERQAKFIVNSVRVYEFWGYEWRIPLWDNQLMDFFSGVPLKLRLEKKLYDPLVDRVYGAFCNERANMLDISSIKRLIKRFRALYRFLYAAKSSIRPRILKLFMKVTLWVFMVSGIFQSSKKFS